MVIKQRPTPVASPPAAVARTRQRLSAIKPVSQVVLSFKAAESVDTFVAIRTSCLRWISARSGRPLPDTAWNGETFDLEDIGAQRVGAVSIDSPRYWAARLDDADKNVAQRTWVTEIGLAQSPGGDVLFGVRLICVTRGDDVPYDRSIPGFVRPIIESSGALLDGRPIRAEPWLVSTKNDVDALVKLLRDPARSADVVVFSLPEDSEDPSETAASAEDVHRQTLGATHVVILTGPASFHLSDRLGRELSVFHKGIRSYLAGFNPDQDQPFRHPLGLPERIETWPDGGPDAYARMLINQALSRSVTYAGREDRLPSFATIRRLSAQRSLDKARRTGSSEKELLDLAWEEIASLRKAMEEEKKSSDDLLATAVREREEAEQDALQTKAQAYALRSRFESLEQEFEELGQTPKKVPIPTTLDDFQLWCNQHLSGAVLIHNRAYQGIKKSQFQDIAFIYKTLLLLRDHYVPMRRQGGDDRQRAYETACNELGLEESGTISGERLGEQGDTYIVTYAGRRCILERHLKKGASKNQRICFRLYFFWDADGEQAIVGWLPSHLDTRAT
jgi:hypothetical protein